MTVRSAKSKLIFLLIYLIWLRKAIQQSYLCCYRTVTCQKSINQSETGTNSIFKCCCMKRWRKSTKTVVSFSQDKCKRQPRLFVRADILSNTTTGTRPHQLMCLQSVSRAVSHQGHLIIQKKTACTETTSGWQGQKKGQKHCKEGSRKGRRQPETVCTLRNSIERKIAEVGLEP